MSSTDWSWYVLDWIVLRSIWERVYSLSGSPDGCRVSDVCRI